MNLQERIKKRQNDQDMLECQYSARYYYNAAEIRNAISLFFSILAAFCVVIPNFSNTTISSLILFLPILFSFLSILFIYLMKRKVLCASTLRNYFDDNVLEFFSNKRSQDEIRKIHTLIIDATSKHRSKFEEQITNTGRDNPPGVKNWYEFSKEYSDTEVVFECQKQNQWWNKRMLCIRLIFSVVLLSFILLGTIALCLLINIPVPKILASFCGLIVILIDRIVENKRYICLSSKIDNFFEAYSVSKSKKQIKALQELLESRRSLPVLEINFIHKKLSRVLSERYEDISKNS